MTQNLRVCYEPWVKLLLPLVITLMSCGSRTELVTLLDVQPGVLSVCDRFNLVVRNLEGQMISEDSLTADQVRNGFRRAFVPRDGDGNRVVRITASGTRPGELTPWVVARVTRSFEPGESRVILITLFDVCGGVPCSDAETCRGDTGIAYCVSAETGEPIRDAAIGQ